MQCCEESRRAYAQGDIQQRHHLMLKGILRESCRGGASSGWDI